MTDAPFADVEFLDPAVEMESLPDGGILLRNPNPLDPYPDHLIERLRHWAAEAPDRDFLCERDGSGEWRRVTYADAARLSASIAQALLDRGHGPGRPIAILSDNSIDFALLMLGAMHVAIPVMPVSPAYSLMSKDHEKLKAVISHHDPSLIFVEDKGPFEAALTALDMSGRSLVTSVPAAGADTLGEWMKVAATDDVEAALATVGPDTVAKILLTSGSTGLPKGVINTWRMMSSNQAAMTQCWRFTRKRPPVLMDWLPWNHTFGGNFNFNFVLYLGGTYYIDEGRPVPGRIERTLANLREVSPTVYLNVPRGFDIVIPVLETDAELRDAVFRDLDMIFFAGAALPSNLRQKLEALSIAARGVRVPVVTSLGATETAPAGTMMSWDSDVSGNIGVPLPGIDVKLVPNGSKLEVRFKGPNVTPGYYKRPELAEEMFDDEGFFRIGDAARLLDPDDPVKGMVFDGRVAENFKLMSGTWVHAGTLRLAAIAASSPIMQDAVVTGHDREEVGLLVFPNAAGCRAVCPGSDDLTPLEELIGRPELAAHLIETLRAHNAENPGSSTRIRRVMVMEEPPSIDANEITDKGYINQRAVVERRAALIDALYADPPGERVILIDP